MVNLEPVPAIFVYAAGGGLTTAVTALFAWVKSTNTRVQRKLDKCEEEHEKTRKQSKHEIDKLRDKVEKLTVESVGARTCPVPNCPVKMAARPARYRDGEPTQSPPAHGQ